MAIRRILAIGGGIIAGYLMTLGVVQVAHGWGLFPEREAIRAADQVKEALLLLNRHSIEPEKVGPGQLADRAITSMVGTLDPYSDFLTAEENARMEEELDGEFGGVGVQIEEVDGKVVVVAPIAGTPGERAGIQRGDILVQVDGRDVRGLKMDQYIVKLRGEPGSEIRLVVERGEPAQEIAFTIIREVIHVQSVPEVALLAGEVGYVRVVMFGETTGKEFKAAVRRLREQGARALVIDLRNNPGGLLDAAVEVVEPFFPRGELVVYTQGRTEKDRQELRAKGERTPWLVPTAVLVNGGSASAAEIVAGALRDTQRAVLVGEKTFGKGSVQTLFPLRGEAALRLTTARYYTPSGDVIHQRGIAPDVVAKLTPDEEKAVFMARLRPDVKAPAEFEKKFGVPPAVDVQLQAALRELEAELAGAAPTRAPREPVAVSATLPAPEAAQ